MRRMESNSALGVDASNLRAGGGLTHLYELLQSAEMIHRGFDKVVVWGSRATLSGLPSYSWLEPVHCPMLERSLPVRALWQRFVLPRLARESGCVVLFVPGGTDRSGFSPMVTMCRNMLPFDVKERSRYGLSYFGVKLWALRRAQAATFARSTGVIFLTDYALRSVTAQVSHLPRQIAVIPHGLNERFFRKARATHPPSTGTRVLYVSSIFLYKHQEVVVSAVASLRRQGLEVTLDLVGNGPRDEVARLSSAIADVDPRGEYISLHRSVPYEGVTSFYHRADICVFASTCENMPNILLESMASGAAVVSSNVEPMPEILGDAGEYFDATSDADLADKLCALISEPGKRKRFAEAAQRRARNYSWSVCAERTFEFLNRARAGAA